MFNDKPTLILSPARTGSNFLAEYITNRFYPGCKILSDPEFKFYDESPRFVAKSHEFYNPVEYHNQFTVMFNIRENVIEPVLSRILANQYSIWEWAAPGTRTFEPFDANLDQVVVALEQQMAWYNHYAKYLTQKSIVVSYEVLTTLLPFNTWESLNRSLITNLEQVIETINLNLTTEFIDNHRAFVDWKTLPDRPKIYAILQGYTL